MILKSYPLSGKWIYIFSVYGCSLKSTNGQSFDIPSGFFALSREEIQTFFTNNYLTIGVDDRDTSFTCFSYDFAINSVQPLSDVTNSLILQQVSDSMIPLLTSIENLTRINQNNLSILMNAYLENNTTVEFGGLVGTYNQAGFFELYLPVNSSKFNFTYIVNAQLPVTAFFNLDYQSLQYNDYSFYIDYTGAHSPFGLGSDSFQVYLTAGSVNGSEPCNSFISLSNSVSIPVKFFNSNGVPYEGYSVGAFQLKKCSVSGGASGSIKPSVGPSVYSYVSVSETDLTSYLDVSYSDGVLTISPTGSEPYIIVKGSPADGSPQSAFFNLNFEIPISYGA